MYYDGQFDDARVNVSLACTAAAAGGTVVNYVECEQLIKVAAHVTSDRASLPACSNAAASACIWACLVLLMFGCHRQPTTIQKQSLNSCG